MGPSLIARDALEKFAALFQVFRAVQGVAMVDVNRDLLRHAIPGDDQVVAFHGHLLRPPFCKGGAVVVAEPYLDGTTVHVAGSLAENIVEHPALATARGAVDVDDDRLRHPSFLLNNDRPIRDII